MNLNILIPITATIAAVCATVYLKYILMHNKMNNVHFAVLTFWGVFIALLPGIFFFDPPTLLPTNSIWLFALVALLAISWNLLYFKGMKEETLVESQLVIMLIPLFAAFSGFIFFQDERDASTLFFLLIGIGAILWSHIEHNKLKWDHGALFLLCSSILVVLESMLIKILVQTISPYWVYLIRISSITLLISLIFPKYLHPKSLKNVFYMITFGAIIAVQFVFTYWSFSLYGIVFTNLILAIVPVLAGLAGVVFFHNKITHKEMIAGAILLVCIILAQFF